MTPLLELCFAELASQAKRYQALRLERARLMARERIARECIRAAELAIARHAQQRGA